MHISILSYNIHKGFSARNRDFILSAIRQAIRDTGAEIVMLQEVIGEHTFHASRHQDWPTEEQFEYLADGVWHHHAYGKNAVYDEGHHGNAILSKYPIIKYDNFDISAGNYEQRGLLYSQIKIPTWEKPIECFCTHLGLFAKGRVAQLHQIADLVDSNVLSSSPTLIGGDFNDWQRKACGILTSKLKVSDAYRSFHKSLPRTFPSLFPILNLDRVYHRNMLVKEAFVLRGKPWNRLSDHLPIFVNFELYN